MTDRQRRRRLIIGVIAVVLAILALTAAWRWTPLHEYAQPRVVARAVATMAQSAWLPVLMMVIYVASNAVMFPITVLCFATILALGTHPGLTYATVGSLLAALAAYAAGRRYGAQTVEQLDVKGVSRMSLALRKGGILQITLLRLLPLAPFSIVNLMAGAARVRVVPFTVGTILGMLPGNLLFTVFGRQLRQLIVNPTPAEIGVMAAVTVGISLVFWYLHRLTVQADRG